MCGFLQVVYENIKELRQYEWTEEIGKSNEYLEIPNIPNDQKIIYTASWKVLLD